MRSRVPALLIMHADLGAALLRAAEQVYGPITDIEVLSNEGQSRHSLEQEIGRRISTWVQGGLVLTDFWGGSCHTCGASAIRGHGEIAIVTGINLPLLLDYLHNRDAFDVLPLAERLLLKGQQSIRVQRSPGA